MRPIPPKLKEEILSDPYYKKCARSSEGNCEGRITFEHAIIYAGKQVNEKWAIIPICAFHHAVDKYQDSGDLNKEKHEWIALSRATELDRQKYYKINWSQRLSYLNGKYNI